MIITLSLPPPLNQTYRTVKGYVYKTRAARDWEQEADWAIRKSWKGKPMEGNVTMTVRLFLKRDRDLDASLKLLFDLLEKQRVYKNDRQVKELHVCKLEDKDWPRCEVTVEEA